MTNLNARIHEIPVGVEHEMEPVDRTKRTGPQLDRVTAIVRSYEFAFATSNPFTRDLGNYRGPFTFAWYDKLGKLHMTRIEPDGSINEAHSFIG